MAGTKWRSIANLKTAAVLPWTRRNLYRCDPYLVWADAVTSGDETDDELNIAVLVELQAAADYQDFLQRMNAHALRFLPNGFEPVVGSRFVTALVNRPGLAALIAEVLEQRVERFSLQNSREDIARTALKGYEEFLALYQRNLRSDSVSPSPDGQSRSRRRGTGTYLGIIDDGLPALKVRNGMRPLLDPPAHLWDQGWQPPQRVGSEIKPGEPPAQNDKYWDKAWTPLVFAGPPDKPLLQVFRGFFYGRRLRKLPTAAAAEPPNDRDEYAEIGYFSPAPRQTHGARVLGLMAPWLTGAKGPIEWPEYISGLAMVQLPTVTVLDTSGGSLAMRVLDGMRYILWQEEVDRADGGHARPIVANLSYGTHAGPHDGTSMFERALDEMLACHPHLHVVLPAGNAARSGCHARRELSAKGKKGDCASLSLHVLPDNGRDTFVEIWIPRGGEVVLRIRPPGSDELFEIGEGEAKIHFVPDAHDPDIPDRVHFGAVYGKQVAQGTEGGMILLAIGPTRRVTRSESLGSRALNQQPRREVAGSPGVWELTLRNVASSAVAVDAWIERDDAPPDVSSGSRQAYFPDSCRAEVRASNATPEDTLNGIATLRHERLHIVGAMRVDGALSEYSAAGPARTPSTRRAPDIVAPADFSGNMPGLRTMGFVRGVVTRINGTSAACAVYARALAAKLGQVPTPPETTPPDTPPEFTCVTDSQPEANPKLRGQKRRRLLPFEVEL